MNDQPASVSSQLKQGVYSSIGCLGLLVFAVILTVVTIGGNPNRQSKPPAPVLAKNPYRYTIDERSDISLKGMPRLVVRVRLATDELPIRERMIDTAAEIWAKENQRWVSFTVFMIGGEIRDFSAGAYGIAEFTPSGLKAFQINDVPLKMLKIKAAIATEQMTSERK